MRNSAAFDSEFQNKTRIPLIAGGIALVAALAGLFISGPALFFQGYLLAFLFLLGISLGSLLLLLLHYTVGTHWGLTIRRIAEAGANTIWLMAILFIPLLFGLQYLFPWARPEAVAESGVLQYKSFYLNVPFFIIRAVIFFAIWSFLTWLTGRWSARWGGTVVDDPHMRGRLQARAAGGLILFVLSMTFASIDWLMSLQPHWTSTAFGLIVIIGQALSALSFALLMLNLFPSLSMGRRWISDSTPVPYKDLGAFLMVFILGWTYVSFFQFLIMWTGDIPREVVWYIERTSGGWGVLIALIALTLFVVPFLMLLSPRVRHNLRLLAGMGAMLLAATFLNVFWHVKPAFFPGTFSVSWLDIVLPIALGAIWLAVFFYMLARRPTLSVEEQAVLQIKSEAERAVY
jgi:hypothetical protein